MDDGRGNQPVVRLESGRKRLDEPTQFDQAREAALRGVADAVHRLNRAITQAVDCGLTIELMRASRYHHPEGGRWGDQMVPIVQRHP